MQDLILKSFENQVSSLEDQDASDCQFATLQAATTLGAMATKILVLAT